jgi:hypothetical protein
MRVGSALRPRTSGQGYRKLREDPRYDEIKRIIESLPPEKMKALKSYIERWLGNS